jgi:hypothetical protein
MSEVDLFVGVIFITLLKWSVHGGMCDFLAILCVRAFYFLTNLNKILNNTNLVKYSKNWPANESRIYFLALPITAVRNALKL